MTASIINGKAIAQEIRQQLKLEIDTIKERGDRPPCLAVILVGNDPAVKSMLATRRRLLLLVLKVGLSSYPRKRLKKSFLLSLKSSTMTMPSMASFSSYRFQNI